MSAYLCLLAANTHCNEEQSFCRTDIIQFLGVAVQGVVSYQALRLSSARTYSASRTPFWSVARNVERGCIAEQGADVVAGAGPLGPFVMPPAGAGPIDMGPQMGGHRGQRGPGRGARQGRGGFGGNMGGGRGYGGRGYFDLDAPENQRSVLDYGDL